MRRYRPVIATLVALLFYTLTDILVWQRIFEAHNMVEFAGTYHAGWFVSLAGYASMGILLMWGQWKDCLYFVVSLFITAFSGLEDILYYVLDRKPMPDSLPWLRANPLIYGDSRLEVIGSVLFWLAALALFYALLYSTRRRRATAPGDTLPG
ncbi:MAG TPA: hypothetical protein VIU39_03635 [Anaerolineales bacterium]